MDGPVEQLLTVDPAVLTLDDQLTHLAAVDSALARFAAARERALAAVHDPADPKNWLVEEVGCLLRWSFPYTQARLAQASHLTAKLPRLLDLHAQGLVGEMHVRAAAEATFGLDAAVIAKVEERVLGRAGSQTPALFRASLRRAVAAEDARTAEQRHAEAKRKEKVVRLCPLPDGMAGIWSVHTAVDAEAIYAQLREITATTSPGDARGDQRGVDERRADALRDLVLGRSASGSAAGRVHVQLLIPAAVAAGASELPGELVGYGPIPASLCRDAMQQPGTTVERVHLDHDGQVIPPDDVDSDRDRYRPGVRMQRHLHAQWPTCRFPGCNRRAPRCDTDHIDPFDGTNTITVNLQPLCPRHHHLKHETGWTVTRRQDGVTEWTSPTGRHYDKPPDERPPPDL